MQRAPTQQRRSVNGVRSTRQPPAFDRHRRHRRITAAAVAVLAGTALTGCSSEAQRSARPDPSAPASTAAPSSSPGTGADRGPAAGTPSPEGNAGEPTGSRALRPRTPEQQQQLDAQLREAAWANDVPRARRLIRRGADVNARYDTEQN